jgi:hypothetical protein
LQQLDFIPVGSPHQEEVTPDLLRAVRRRPTFLRAWHFAQELSGLEDKEVYGPLGIDASHWTRIKNGAASPPADERFVQYMDIVHNEIPLIWLAESRGYDWQTIRKHQSDLEKENARLRKELEDRDRAMSLLARHMTGK